jgi:hypothetical protein
MKRTDSGTTARARRGRYHSPRIARCERWRSDAQPDGLVSRCRFLFTLKSAIQRCVFFVHPSAGCRAGRSVDDSLHCRRAFWRCPACGSRVPGPATPNATRCIPPAYPSASSVVIGYALSFSGVRDLSKSHDSSTRRARSHEITVPNCWCERLFGRFAARACEAASHASRVRGYHTGFGRTCIFESARAVRQRRSTRAPVLSPQ